MLRVIMDFCISYWWFRELSTFSNSFPTCLTLEAVLQMGQVMRIIYFETDSHRVFSSWFRIHSACGILDLDSKYLDQLVSKSCLVVPIHPKNSQDEIRSILFDSLWSYPLPLRLIMAGKIIFFFNQEFICFRDMVMLIQEVSIVLDNIGPWFIFPSEAFFSKYLSIIHLYDNSSLLSYLFWKEMLKKDSNKMFF